MVGAAQDMLYLLSINVYQIGKRQDLTLYKVGLDQELQEPECSYCNSVIVIFGNRHMVRVDEKNEEL